MHSLLGFGLLVAIFASRFGPAAEASALWRGGAKKGKSRMRPALLVLLLLTSTAIARDNGQYTDSPLKPWFDSLRSAKGYCCSQADGRETEYDIRQAHYWVPVDGVWTAVPDDAVITEPNKMGRPMVWLTPNHAIRCFIPGSGL
jgi:hypothetical protein